MNDNTFSSYAMPTQTVSERRAEIYFDTLVSVLKEPLTPASHLAARFEGVAKYATDPNNDEDQFIVVPELAQFHLKSAIDRVHAGRISAALSSIEAAREVTRSALNWDKINYVRNYAYYEPRFRLKTPGV